MILNPNLEHLTSSFPRSHATTRKARRGLAVELPGVVRTANDAGVEDGTSITVIDRDGVCMDGLLTGVTTPFSSAGTL